MIGGASSDEVANARGKLVSVGLTVGLDPVDEAWRLEHGADDVRHRFIKAATAGSYGGGDTLEEVDFLIIEWAAEEIFSDAGDGGAERFLREAAAFGKEAHKFWNVDF